MLIQLAEFLSQPLMMEDNYTAWLASLAKSPTLADVKPVLNDVKMAANNQVAAASKSNGKVIAVLPVRGIIAPRDSWILQYIGGTALDTLVEGIDICLNEPRVGGIIFDFDTPGGSACGVKCTADYIFSVRSQKPMVSVVRYLAASAGYYLAAATSRIIAEQTSLVGSVGSATVHQEFSKQLAADGVSVTVIRSPEFKMEGHPAEPLTDAAKAFMQTRIDELTHDFTSDVARYRGTDQKTVMANYGQGRAVSVADALKAGMIDKIGTFAEVVAQMSSGTMARSLAQSSRMEGDIDSAVLRNRMALAGM